MIVILILGFAASLFIPFGRGYGWGMIGRGMMGWFGLPFFWGLIMLVFWVLGILGAAWLFRAVPWSSGRSTSNAQGRESPLDILRVRYAKGEITKDQFDQMRRDIGT